MDIVSHGLWSVAAYEAAGGAGRFRRAGTRFNAWYAAFFGMFPDLFAFTIPTFWLAAKFFAGDVAVSDFPHPGSGQTLAQNPLPIFRLAASLYDVSHSLFVFAAVFLAVWAIRRRPLWELGGWLLHILLDIPTHSARFFPTPLFWPVSGWKFMYGFSWSAPWFLLPNYILLAVAYVLIWKKRKKGSPPKGA